MTSGDRHSELVQLELRFRDTTLNSLGNSTKVVILELLPAWRGRADERTPSHHQIGAHGVVRAIDEEVFLLGPEGGEDALDTLVAEDLEELDGLLGEDVRAAQQRGHLIERLAVVADEHRRNA